MVSLNASKPEFPLHEGDAEFERDARIRREAKVIAQAEADIDAGLGIDDDNLETWLDALERDEHASIPSPRGIGQALR